MYDYNKKPYKGVAFIDMNISSLEIIGIFFQLSNSFDVKFNALSESFIKC